MTKKYKKVKVEEKKMGRRRYKGSPIIGWADNEKHLVEVEITLKDKAKMKTLIHELIHIAFPDACETKVLKAERIIGNTLWEKGYRRMTDDQ